MEAERLRDSGHYEIKVLTMWCLPSLLVAVAICLFWWFISSDARRLTARSGRRRRPRPCPVWTDDASPTLAGGFFYRSQRFHFTNARCHLDSEGGLSLRAAGDHCSLMLVDVPFPGATSITELAGQVWDPDDNELMENADVFAEGGLEIDGRQVLILGGRIECRSFDPELGTLSVAFRLAVQQEEDPEEHVDGVAKCHVRKVEDHLTPS
jgi:hypothetical protein